MTEKLDITKAYIELKETIEKGDHNQILIVCNKILNEYPSEKEAMKSKIEEAIIAKPEQHELLDAFHCSEAGRYMNEIGG